MKACVNRMKLLVEGDLETPMPEIRNKDETGVLVKSTEALVEGLRIVIGDISYLLNEMANQNLDIHTEHEETYVGSFQDILHSMRNMRIELCEAMRQVNHSAKRWRVPAISYPQARRRLARVLRNRPARYRNWRRGSVSFPVK